MGDIVGVDTHMEKHNISGNELGIALSDDDSERGLSASSACNDRRLAGYSNLAHLCDALLLRPDTLMLIIAPDPLVLYCDASRTNGDQHHVVAGAIGTVESWKQFDKDWRTALNEFHIEYFRMSEFAHSVGQFAVGWKKNEHRRRALVERLITIMAKGYILHWTGTCVSQKDYDEADTIYQLHETLRP
jgi:hypothetical protein